MHDIKPRQDICRLCKKEATDMAKEKTICACGGSFDGTPSGRQKHVKTGKHIEWALAEAPAETPAPTIEAGVGPGGLVLIEKDPVASEEGVLPNGLSLDAKEAVLAGLTALIDNGAQELARRQGDHKWRVAHNTAEYAANYFASKVAPLREEQATLRAARKMIAEGFLPR